MHSSVLRGMLKQMTSIASLGDNGVMHAGVHTITTGCRKMSNVPWPCGFGVKEIRANKRVQSQMTYHGFSRQHPRNNNSVTSNCTSHKYFNSKSLLTA